jgi:CheY-like chemotaxis protein
MGSELTGAEFIRDLRQALRYLYVTAELRKSRLLPLLGLEGQGATAALRTALTEAIAALKPDAATPPRARPWRIYNTLLYLYIQQLSQEEVATALGISSRQLRRQENQALQLLAEHLAARHGLTDRLRREGGTLWPAQAIEEEAIELAELQTDTPSREQELEWLGKSDPSQVTDLCALLERSLRTVAPLAERLAVTVTCEPAPFPLRVAIQPAIMQQALVMALTAAIRSAPGGRVTVRAVAAPGAVSLAFCLAGTGGIELDLAAAEAAPDIAESLRMGEQLVRLAGGRLEAATGVAAADDLMEVSAELAGGPALRLLLPTSEELTVLVVDDHTDSLRLFQRYLTGTRYTFIGARDAAQALALAEKARPSIVVLDVMLPEVDGWQLLGQLRAHPRLIDVPVIICTILPEEQLALALGAVGYLRKPVSRQAFLTALDRQASRQATEAG